MELDKRIIKGKRPLTCFDVEEAKAFLGKECYFSNAYCTFEDLNYTPKAILQYVFDNKDASDPYKTACYYYPFCLPCEWVEEEKKEPKYRPLTNTEFVDLFDSGKLRSIRLKDNSTKRLERLIITDIYVQGDYLYAKLNSSDTGYGPAYFFSKCEYFDGKEWKIFGIKE